MWVEKSAYAWIIRAVKCHPPCEDVSWKVVALSALIALFVILLVRMWVEKSECIKVTGKELSSSLWGCELKSIAQAIPEVTSSHPPCEDVSWKMVSVCELGKTSVILLVRMWVEKSETGWTYAESTVILLVRMWVEKWNLQWHNTKTGKVILLVRMWVEKSNKLASGKGNPSSSLWGCELKIMSRREYKTIRRHPPCEDVSWKFSLKTAPCYHSCHPPCEDVSWKN